MFTYFLPRFIEIGLIGYKMLFEAYTYRYMNAYLLGPAKMAPVGQYPS